MMNRRNFIQRATSAGVAAALGAHCAPILFANAPDPNNPNDPNAILDPDHEIGKPYVGWKEGELDLHFIHTGITENCFHIYPDGTTTLLDCGDRNWKKFGKTSWNPTKKDEAACQPKPDDSRRCGEWVARYIKRLLPNLETIDYAIASHFHTDHTGGSGAGLRRKGLAGDADYMISGISHVGEYYRFGVAFDRGYPTYDRPTTWSPKERENLIKFWDYAEKTQGLKREEFIVGALDQIKLTKAPEKYNFHIRNLARNGVVWGGPNGETIDFFERYPRNKEENQNENTRSLANLIQYGAFRFYTGGDLCGVLRDDDDNDVDYEGRVGRVAGPVDVCKTNHHSSGDAMRASFVKAIQARVYITCCWWMGHLNMGTSKTMCDSNLYEGARLLCPTDPHPMNAEKLVGQPWRGSLVERIGHVVVKAYDGGARYKVYYITAEDESSRVDLVFGPFDSKGDASVTV